jgi:multidrug resistance efflux pump
MSVPETQPPAVARPRRVRIFLCIGLLALAVSLVAAANPGWGRGDKPAPTPSASSVEPSHPKAVCFGFGDIEQGITALYPQQPGRVIEVMIKEGSDVAAGQPLIRVDDALAKLQVREAKAALAAAELRLEEARTRKAQHDGRIAAAQAAVDAARQDAEIVRAKHDYAVRAKSDITPEQFREASAAVPKAEACIRAREAELAMVKAVDPGLAVRLAEQDIAAKRIDVDKAELALKECMVAAPSKGTVLRLNVTVGDVLSTTPHQPAIQFCPDAPRIVRAEVEQEFSGAFPVGARVVILDDATTSERWKGIVTRTSGWYTHRRSILMEPMQYNDVRTLECVIQLDDKENKNSKPLRIGQRVRVEVEQ